MIAVCCPGDCCPDKNVWTYNNKGATVNLPGQWARSVALNGLAPVTEYFMTVRAWNDIGYAHANTPKP